MESNQEIFRFDLDESLYFEAGQEVSEMTGISLDPEISIQPVNDYVSIRGVMELRGSYLKGAVSDPENDLSDFSDEEAKRYIENVVNIDEEQAEFSHRFPIEISVPAHRVQNTDDVTVNIGAFDYELTNPNQLKLSSTVEIRGIQADSSQMPNHDTDASESPGMLRNGDDSFAFDYKLDQEEMDTEEQAPADMPPPPSLSQQTTSLENEDSKQTPSSTDEKERTKHKKSQTLSEFFGTEAKGNAESSAQEPSLEVTSSENSPEPEASARDLADAGDQDDNDESSSLEDIRYLADMFEDEEEETYSQMRLYIVQDFDTIESIASRYDISAMQIIRQNRFAEEGLEEGQLLYIPHKRHS